MVKSPFVDGDLTMYSDFTILTYFNHEICVISGWNHIVF